MPKEIKSLSKGLMLYKEILSYSKPILAKTLCERLSIDKSTMSRLLQTLKNENFIEYLENFIRDFTLIAFSASINCRSVAK